MAEIPTGWLITDDDVLAVMAANEPATCEEVRVGLGVDKSTLGTVRNRLWALAEAGILTADEGRPVRFRFRRRA